MHVLNEISEQKCGNFTQLQIFRNTNFKYLIGEGKEVLVCLQPLSLFMLLILAITKYGFLNEGLN